MQKVKNSKNSLVPGVMLGICDRKRFDVHRLFLYITKKGSKWTRRGEESESGVTDSRTIHEQSYLYMYAKREKGKKERESKR
jgi:hypothetical protein